MLHRRVEVGNLLTLPENHTPGSPARNGMPELIKGGECRGFPGIYSAEFGPVSAFYAEPVALFQESILRFSTSTLAQAQMFVFPDLLTRDVVEKYHKFVLDADCGWA